MPRVSLHKRDENLKQFSGKKAPEMGKRQDPFGKVRRGKSC